MCILHLERFFLAVGVCGGLPDAECKTTNHTDTGWDITSLAAAVKAVTMAAHKPKAAQPYGIPHTILDDHSKSGSSSKNTTEGYSYGATSEVFPVV
jgi:hypothetical protein